MPRWLSEGISVYEELQANPTWGQTMTPRYREMILGKDFTPLGELSAAFLAPKTEMHLQFAYYESYLAVDYLAGRFGIDAIKKILRDLGEGIEINAAITNHTGPLEQLNKDFAAFARERAEKLAPELDFKKPDRGDDGEDADTKNYYLLVRQARKHLREKKWPEAKAPAEKLLKAFPGNTGPENAYSLLAEAHRGLGETNEERTVLTKLAGLEADDLDTYSRLMELDSVAKDWAAVAKNAERFLAVNPLMATPYRHLAEASERLGQRDSAIAACKALLLLDPPDPAGTHFQLARLLHQTGDPGAKRHLLQALEEAPRFRAAHKLLLELTRPASAPSKSQTPLEAAPPPPPAQP
jgi:tetratricopeptide (TPR) repeat protein